MLYIYDTDTRIFMTKVMLHLSIEPELVNIAKSSNMNLSKEFEEWIRIRLNQTEDNKPIIDIQLEKAKLKAQLLQLDNQEALNKQEVDKQTIEDNSLDTIIDNMKQFNEDFINISDIRIHGVQFIMKKRYNKVLNSLESKELLIKRLKERGLIPNE